MKKYVFIFLALVSVIYISQNSQNIFGSEQSLLQKTIESNKIIYAKCFWTEAQWTGSDTEKYRSSTECWKSKRSNTPNDLYLTLPRSLIDGRSCSISQSEDDHVRPERGWMYATDIACNFKEQGVYAPDYLDDMKEYKIESVWIDNLLGNFVILSFKDNPDIRWYFGHTVLDSGWKVWDTITTWVRFAHANLSGATTGWHTHIELRRNIDAVWQSVRYVTRAKERKLDEKRMGSTGSVATIQSDTYYFTHYDLWDKKQNDEDPCTSADGKDSCKLHSSGRSTMALTMDIRNKMWIKFWDKVILTGEVGCEWVYTVTDEMACRFRGENSWSNGPCYYSDKVTPAPKVSNILRKDTPYFIKGDLPGRPGWACQIKKL